MIDSHIGKPKNLPVEFVQVSHVSQVMYKADLKLNIGAGVQIEIPDGFSQVTLEQGPTNDRTIYNSIHHFQSEKNAKQCSDNMIDGLHTLQES